MSRTAWLRAPRAVASGAVVTGSAIAAHGLSGGGLPTPVAFGVLVFVTALAWPLTSRRLGSRELLGLMLLAQAGTHLACDAGAGGGAMLMAHLVAVGVSLAVLRGGEDALWSLLERLALRGPRPAVPLTAIAAVRTRFVANVGARRVFDAAVPWRGPPVNCSA